MDSKQYSVLLYWLNHSNTVCLLFFLGKPLLGTSSLLHSGLTSFRMPAHTAPDGLSFSPQFLHWSVPLSWGTLLWGSISAGGGIKNIRHASFKTPVLLTPFSDQVVFLDVLFYFGFFFLSSFVYLTC